jgi:hypothetical protein
VKQQAVILIIALFGILFGSSKVFAQHSHNGHTTNNQTIKTPEVLPTGLSDVKSSDLHPMDVDSSQEKPSGKNDQQMEMDKCKEKMSDMKDQHMDMDKCKEKMSDMKDQHMDMDSCKQKMNDMKDHKTKIDSKKSNDSIIRIGEVDLKAIDINKDGKVYQDQMDWNVISDEPGNCPKCNMTLKEVTLEKAKENLIKHNFQVKG